MDYSLNALSFGIALTVFSVGFFVSVWGLVWYCRNQHLIIDNYMNMLFVGWGSLMGITIMGMGFFPGLFILFTEYIFKGN